MELLKIYEKIMIRADILLSIFQVEKGKEENSHTEKFLKQTKNQQKKVWIMQKHFLSISILFAINDVQEKSRQVLKAE